jgi:bifunctional UDP-N-acetylglucosamine pyrophosphorylase/glucosamine-1-phosphate N-acetyltransferase
VERALIAAHLAVFAAAGAVIVDPNRTWCGLGVTVEAGARIWPDVVLRGATVVRAGAEVQSGCWIEDSEIGPDAIVRPHSVLSGARLGSRCRVGPMAHLRPGTVLGDDVHVGNFVETKAATLGPGAKANHLTYLGDVEVGARANIGAGTITCNYDGWGKYRTEIGAGAFIGSNSALVAPVRVGAGAVVGAGSVITRDVPDDAVALERAELRILPDRAPALHAQNRRKAGR